jgi:hypothetical protein
LKEYLDLFIFNKSCKQTGVHLLTILKVSIAMCDLRTQNGVPFLALVITFRIFLCTKLPGKRQKLKLLNIKYEKWSAYG